jgi:NADP-dependent 3-hydroxy acid dehydrogenase YdfG
MESVNLSGKVVFITGASSGIGKVSPRMSTLLR